MFTAFCSLSESVCLKTSQYLKRQRHRNSLNITDKELTSLPNVSLPLSFYRLYDERASPLHRVSGSHMCFLFYSDVVYTVNVESI